MPLHAGQALAHYAILAPLGAGAMGEVYRARDTKLGREVAIKVLPEHFANDAERLKRFEREAKALASLNHPNVAQIHGVDQIGDTCFLVLELVPGESLEERLKRGPLPLGEALDVCRQIAEGLEAAHDAGVIHRDLKPANVRLAPDGKVKVLDFGLAKPASESGQGSSTDSVLTTEAGRLLGTPTYMAPEQARGKAIDRRVDIWAFGCVLYECLTARHAFAGESLTDVLAAVIEREADWAALPPNTPPRVRELLRRCLAKEVKQRLQAIGEARIVLGNADERSAGSRAAPERREHATRAGGRRDVWLGAIAAVAAIGWASTAVVFTSRKPAASVDLRASLALPDSVGIPILDDSGGASLATLAVSPLGDQVAYAASKGADGALYLRKLDSFAVGVLPNTAGAYGPFFAPEGRRLAFFALGHIWRIDLPGGVPVDLGPSGPVAVGGTWTNADTIVYTPSYADGLYILPASGGEARALTTVDRAAGEVSHRWPHALPNGAGVLFVIKSASNASLDDARIAIADLETGKYRVLLEGGSSPRYLESGHLVFARAGHLYAVEFDLASKTVRGAPSPVLDGVATQPVNGAAWYDVTRRGLLVYLANDKFEVPVARFSLEGPGRPPELLDSLEGRFSRLRLSRDFKLAISKVIGANNKLWMIDLERRNSTPLTAGGGNDDTGVLSPDGRWLLFSSDRAGGGFRFYRAPLDGSSPPVPWIEGEGRAHSISYPASMVGLTMETGRDGLDAYVVSVAEDGRPTGNPILLAGGPNDQAVPSVSAD